MFGQGIYFATDSSKSGQEIYTKGSHKLLLCDVLIGNCKMVTSADSTLCHEKLQNEQFDSVPMFCFKTFFFVTKDAKLGGLFVPGKFTLVNYLWVRTGA